MKKLFLSALGALALGLTAFADEGMWLLPYLQKTNYADMKAAGLKLKATDIYNPDGPSLKDAIIIFGARLYGEIVSPDGHYLHQPPLRLQQYPAAQHDRERLSGQRFLGNGPLRGDTRSRPLGTLHPQD